ncbi:uncharacterized protein FFNC_15413 [Fusarium fujikuroi]|nr:uncharacterized protein FFNC_15413 [Fusarium fujikuroi]
MPATRTRGLPAWLSAMQRREVTITIAHRTFIIWSIHKNPFPEATTRASRLGRYLLASVLSIIQLAFLVGVPLMTSFLAWSTQIQLSPALDDGEWREQATEVVGYLILDTIFLVLMLWGAVPVIASSRFSGHRVRAVASMAVIVMALTIVGVSARAMYLTWNWMLRSKLASDHPRLIGRCRLIFFTSGILLCSGLASTAACVFYTARFGTTSGKEAYRAGDKEDEEAKTKTVDTP